MENRNQLRMKIARRNAADIIRQQQRNRVVDSCPGKSCYYRKQLRSRNRKRMSAWQQESAIEAITPVDDPAGPPPKKKEKTLRIAMYMRVGNMDQLNQSEK